MVRTRFAPSPTGLLHLGGLRTALFNYLFSRKHGGQFLLRIEDTDRTRLVPGAVENIEKYLAWTGIDIDEGPHHGGSHGPYVQSQRLPLYKDHASQLVDTGHAYPCFCSTERLEQLKESQAKQGLPGMYDRRCMSISKADAKARIEAGQPHVIRMKVPNGVTSVNDVLRGRVTFENRTVDDAVLLKSDGFPTYHLASVVDDRLMEITHIIRGEEWLPSVSKHKLLYDAFGWRPPEFVHLPLLLNPDGSKLSKRQGHASVSFYEESGFLPESVLNFVAFLGWNPGSGEEIMSKRELIERFELERLNKAGAIVDMEKLKWVQQQHIRRMCDSEMDRILELARPHFERELPSALQDINYLSQVLRLCSERILFFSDVPRHLYYFFAEPEYTSEDACALRAQLHGYDFCKLTQLCKDALEAIPLEAFSADAMTKVLKEMTKKEKVQYKSAMLHLRYVCTGSSVGANLVDTLQVLGKDRVIARLTAMLGKC